MQRKIARKKTSEANQEESTEVVVFNGHATASDAKTSPETSVPGTESEGSPNEQSPNIVAQLGQFSPQLINDSQNILKSILSLDRSTSTSIQPTNISISMSQEELVQPSITSSMSLNFNQNSASSQFKQTHSYFSAGLSHDQSPQTTLVQMKHTVGGAYSLPALSTLSYNLPDLVPNSIFSEELNTNNSQKNFLKDISHSNSQTPIPNKNSYDITAPIPIHANTNVAIAALDPEQKLRRNSLLSLFSASTSTKQS